MANSVNPDQIAENGKNGSPWSDCWEWQKKLDPDQTVSENDTVDLDLD